MFTSRVHPQSTLTKATLLLVSALTVLSSMTLSPTLPSIREHFHALPSSNVLVPLVLTLHAFFIVIGSPLAGFLVDRFGRKPVLILSALVYGVAGGAGFVLEGIVPLLLSRALLGLATAGTFTSATTLIADYYTGQTRTTLASWQTAVMNFGGVAALLVSGLLSDISWHLPFLIYLLGIALVPLIVLTVEEPPRNTSTHTISRARHTDPTPVGTLLGIYTIMSISMLLFFFVPVQLPFYLHGVLHASATQSGVALAAANLCTGLVALSYSRIHHHFDRMSLIALGFVGLSVGLGIIGFVHTYLLTIIGAFFAGSVAGIVLPTLALWSMEVTPLAVRGRALSGLTSAIFLGQFLSPFVSQPLSQHAGLDVIFVGAAGTALLLALIFILIQWQFASIRVQHADR